MKSGIAGQAGRGTSKVASSTHSQASGAPLLLVSPTSPNTLLVPVESSRRRFLDGRVVNSSESATSLCPPLPSLGPSLPSVRLGIRGSKIPIRSSNKVSSGWCSQPISRSHSLTTLPGEIDNILVTETHQDHAFLPLHTKPSTHLSVSSHNLADGRVNSRRSSESRENHINKGRQTPRHRQSFRSTPCYSSLVTRSSSPCARLNSTATQDHDPYETPYYYTFHLTLRSSSNGPRRGRSLTPNRCGRNCPSSNIPSPESDKAKTCSGLGMNNPENTDDMINVGRKADEDRAKSDIVCHREDGIATSGEGMPSYDTEKHDINQTSTRQENLEETDGEEAPDQNQRLQRRAPSARVKCICFGIVDYLNAVVKEVEQDAFWESWCGDYGPLLTSAPPTGITDSESGIEPLAVSLNLPLNYSGGSGYGCSGGTPSRNKNFKLLRWKSCHDLSPHRRPKTLKRQLTDFSIEGKFSAGVVEVYDGNLGISVVSIGNCNAVSPRLRNNISTRSFTGEKGKVYLKGPASSPSSLARTKNEVRFVASGKCDGVGANDKTLAKHNDEKAMCFNDRPLGDGGRKILLGAVKTVREVHEECVYASRGEEARQQIPSAELDCVLGIQEDDGSGPGLSEDEMQEWSPDGHDRIASKPMWMPAKETRHRTTNEASVRRLHPHLSDAGKTASKAVLIAPPDYRLRSPSENGSRVSRHFSGASRQSSTRSRLSHMYSQSSQGNSSADDDSDTGAELSELERRVLNLSHRRSQLRKQDTNACLIAPPEFKIAEDFPGYPRGLHGMPEF